MVRSKGVVQLCGFMGHEFSGVCMRLEFKRIIPMIVQNIMFVGEVFRIEVSDGLVHPLGSRSCGDYWGASFQEFVCV